MAKPTIFIGSSAEHKNLAFAIQSSLEYDAQPFVWTQGTFEPSHFALESLENALDIADFAVLVCAPEDLTIMREHQHPTVRDNVIFELGMFIGRLSRKRTFLISPRGAELHLPSDLRGLMPETFDPEQMTNPEAGLGPACNKIRVAMQKLGPVQRVNSSDGLEAASSSEITVAANVADNFEPGPEWTLEAFEWGYFIALMEQDADREEAIDKAFRTSKFASSKEALAIWLAWREVAAMKNGRHGDVDLLRTQLMEFPDVPRLHELMGRALDHYGDERGAGEAFTSAAKKASNVQTVAGVVKRALAVETIKADTSRILALGRRLLEMKVESHSEKSAFVSAMESVATAAKFEDIAVTIAEVGVSLSPEDTAARFELARRYADNNQFNLSMLHYESIPLRERSGGAWNNLGVSYERLQMAGMAVAAYEKAAEKGETIAQGNLAQKLQAAGFFNEAQTRAEAAISIKGHHDSLIGVLSSIKKARDDEEQVQMTAKISAKSDQSSRLEIGEAALASGGPDLVGTWTTEDGPVEIRDNGDGSYTGVGEVSREILQRIHGLGIGLGGLFNPPRVEKHEILVKLKRIGNALEGTSTWLASQKPQTLLGSAESKKALLVKVSDDGQTISGFETSYDSKKIEWRRQTDSPAEIVHQIADS